MKNCFLFGHRDAAQAIQKEIEKAVDLHYLEYGIRLFYVGGYGAFDSMAGAAVRAARKKYEDICLFRVIPYHPAEHPIEIPYGFDGTLYPDGMENVPRRFAILRANQYMVENADSIICYVEHIGNTRALLELAKKRKEREHIYVQNLAETD